MGMLKILLIDDDENERGELADHFIRNGFDVHVSENGERGLTTALSLVPDLIVMKAKIPLVNGLEFTRRIKTTDRAKHIPIIAISEDCTPEFREEAMNAGCVSVEIAPVDVRRLLKKIALLLGDVRQYPDGAVDGRDLTSPIKGAGLATSTASIEEMLFDRLTDMRRKIDVSAKVLETCTRDVCDLVRSEGLSSFDQDAGRIIRVLDQFISLMSELLDPRRAKELSAPDADLAKARRMLRHDLANPLGAIMAYAELMLEDAQAAGQTSLSLGLQQTIVAVDTLIADLDVVIDFGLPSNKAGNAEQKPKHGVSVGNGVRRLGDGALSLHVDDVRLLGGGALILLVDDYESNRELLARHLTRQGHRVVTAENGSQALELTEQMKFDLVLLDLMLPDMSGYEVLRRLKAHPRLRSIPVIVISALDEQENVVQCIEGGAEDYLSKPINPILLRARISSCLDRNRIHDIEDQFRQDLEGEKEKYEVLLLNILPRPIIERLSAGETVADQFDDVTVLFSDIVGFTQMSSRLPPQKVVEILNTIFMEYDNLAMQLGVEKIKTIGDGYLAVAGLPTPRPDHAEAVARMALGMVDILHRINPTLDQPIRMRFGIASGPVMAGIIGSHKFVYDVWGNTVNTAARHESYSEPGQIHIAQATADLLRGKFRLTARGTLTMRGLGAVETYFLNGRL